MRIRWLAFFLLASLTLISCKDDKKEEPPAQTPLVILIGIEPTSLDPQIPFDDSDYVLGNIFQPLVRFDSSFRLSRGLALRWTNPDDRTWRFYLDDKAKFSDGSPLRASDVKFSIERLQKLSGSDRQGFTEHITSVEVVDDLSLDIKTDSPLIILNNLVYIPILNERNVLTVKEPPFVGTGPYKIKSWKKGDRVELDRNPHYQKMLAIQEVHFLLSEDPDQVLANVQRLRPDLTLTLPYREIEEFQKLNAEGKIQNMGLRSANGISVFYVVFNLRETIPDFPGKNPLTDLRLRKAIAQATNKQRLVEKVLWGFGRPADQLIAPEILGFDSSIPVAEYSPDKAKKLVEENGYAGLKIPIYASQNGSSVLENTLIEDWAKVGLRGELRLLADDELAERFKEGTMALSVAGFVCGSGDASELLTFLLHSRNSELKYGKGNFAFYSNKEVDRISHENLRVFDPRERLRLLQSSLRIATDELPYLPLLILNDVYLVSDRLKWQPAVNGEITLSDMSFR